MSTLPTPIPRFLLPRGPILLRPRPFLPLANTAIRNASTKPPPKPLPQGIKKQQPPVLAKPDKYRPPSHGARLPRSETQQKSYGPKLTEEDKERMRTKKYPNMMSPEGTFMHWFLNNKFIHVWITMGILVTLGIAAWYIDFVSKTPYRDLIPTKKDLIHHPFETTSRFIDIYKMHVEYMSQQTYQRRMKKIEDAEKRKQFREERIREAEEKGEEYVEDPRYYIGPDGVRRRRVKRWFGIWE
ncbi:hypothetical protein K469DRAFT_561913 [Zopfia rhizophila CBS 207.26]|uniref:Uncharacterized protein n=1 Tax=Zopfia rhizophila CBS 207.26 TaxID=1314779 RepID=A0A6A6EC67_9PEZI|nr:hypothetical protein K469DRAFT_561913 [Zopfia rhizophila CBS 207.26]